MIDKNGLFKFEKLGKIYTGQDGAIYGGYIFCFDESGRCHLHELQTLKEIAVFPLDGSEKLTPHSNSVCFGEKYTEADELPLLYTNVYNTYQNDADKREGTCCVYRICREDNEFRSTLMQIIKIGFADIKGLWRSESIEDIRPYGNFTVDIENRRLYAYTMLDEKKKTRFFEFALPEIGKAGENPQSIVLSEEDIISSFDTDYMHFMQGAVFCKGNIISTEGFCDNINLPAIRVIDLNKKAEKLKISLTEYGLTSEPEFIEYYNGELYYSDGSGDFYRIELGI